MLVTRGQMDPKTNSTFSWLSLFELNDCLSASVRVKILSVPDRGDRLFFSVLVRFIDVGHEKEVKSHQILQLPEQFHSLPGQAVEIVVCRVKPADEDTDWHPKVSSSLLHFTVKHSNATALILFLFFSPTGDQSHQPED